MCIVIRRKKKIDHLKPFSPQLAVTTSVEPWPLHLMWYIYQFNGHVFDNLWDLSNYTFLYKCVVREKCNKESLRNGNHTKRFDQDSFRIMYTCFTCIHNRNIGFSLQIARHVEMTRFALVFGINMFASLLLQTILTSIVVDKRGLNLPVLTQVMLIIYNFV